VAVSTNTAPAAGSDIARECGRAFLGIAQELHHAGELCTTLESKVSQLISHYAGENKLALMQELQQLDILNQLVGALASYASVLGAECISAGTLDVENASRELGLARVAARLRDYARQESHPAAEAHTESGDMQLF